MRRRRANGDGTVYRRKDGRWEGATYVLASEGQRKRFRVYGRTRDDVVAKLVEARAASDRGLPLPERAWRLGGYLDYWLENVVRSSRRPKTYELYESVVRRYLKPALGRESLHHLSTPTVQQFLNQQLQAGRSIRMVQIIRNVLSAALTRAQRDELVSRNVARLVELPAWQRSEVQPWTGAEINRFLTASAADPLYPAFVLLMLYGLRRGEVLGLRWHDVDFVSKEIRIRQQVQRVGGHLDRGPVKTTAGRRDLPLLSMAERVLVQHRASQRMLLGSDVDGAEALIFTSKSGRPIEPRNLVRSFQRICKRAGIRVITVHQIRHTAATMLKDLGVAAREAQLILGHAHVSTTQQIYQHGDMVSRREALTTVERALTAVNGRARSRQLLPSNLDATGVSNFDHFGGPGGTRTLGTLLKRQVLYPTELWTHDHEIITEIDTKTRDRTSSFRAQTASIHERLVRRRIVAAARLQQWVLGAVAVNLAVETTD